MAKKKETTEVVEEVKVKEVKQKTREERLSDVQIEGARKLVESLVYYVDGTFEERRKAAITLLDEYKKKRALEYLEKRYKVTGIEQLTRVQQALVDLGEAETEAAIEALVEG